MERGEFAGAAFECFGLLGESGCAGCTAIFGHRSSLERVEVAIHRCAGLRELALHAPQLGLLLVVAMGERVVCLVDRAGNQVVIIEHFSKGDGDGLLQLLGWYPVVVAALGAVTHTREAGVVVVVSVRGCPDERLSAAPVSGHSAGTRWDSIVV